MTTPLESRPLVEAILALLQAQLGDGVGVYWAGAPRPTPDTPYVVVYPDSGVESQLHRSLTNVAPNELRFQITAVGESAQQAAWAADHAAAAVLGTTVTVPGRRVWPTVREGSQPVQRDDDSTGLWYATAQYLTRSDA
ncbi:hypothetical protein [Microbispora sp. ATCC PTA-5024]|uniref:hypothetical protein n=1 Tax=Microbispora sp. ATCC PTA-5024 TaxID=316330 RepID=UPI0003DD6487|nr:hypothetical protein [Microbispora sp. ATCC PTA-5024]ETK36128.1 hypothetical protein MPTA5024_10915 [Microbispora sp. ATCC PTA-5024]